MLFGIATLSLLLALSIRQSADFVAIARHDHIRAESRVLHLGAVEYAAIRAASSSTRAARNSGGEETEMHPMKQPAALLLGLLLPGCAAVTALGEASKPQEIYELQAPIVASPTADRRDVEVIVEEPRASGALTTDRIMIRPDPLRAQYLPGVRWADPAPAMVQTLILRSLIETGSLSSVGRNPIGVSGDYAVLGELTAFHAEMADGGRATIRLGLIARLVNERTGRVVATRMFEASEDAASSETAAIVTAFDSASQRLMADLVPWLLAGLDPA